MTDVFDLDDIHCTHPDKAFWNMVSDVPDVHDALSFTSKQWTRVRTILRQTWPFSFTIVSVCMNGARQGLDSVLSRTQASLNDPVHIYARKSETNN